MKPFIPLLPFAFALTIVLPNAFGLEGLEERRVEGKDSLLLASAMQESGVIREAYVPSAVPSDHPAMQVTSEFVYKMESLVCREKICEAFRVPTEKMKKLDTLFRKLGVKETTPPVPMSGKRLKPFLYIQSLVCGAEKDASVQTVCFVTAHFKPKKK